MVYLILYRTVKVCWWEAGACWVPRVVGGERRGDECYEVVLMSRLTWDSSVLKLQVEQSQE